MGKKRIISEARKVANHRNNDCTALSALIYKNNKGYNFEIKKGICHAFLRNLPFRDKTTNKFYPAEIIIDFPRVFRLTKRNIALANNYSDYIINRSSYRHVFNKTSKQSYIDKGVVIECKDFTATEIASSLIALRMGWEKYRQVPYIFNFLVNKGVDEGVAFLLSNVFIKKQGLYLLSSYQGHCPISGGCSWDKIKDLIRGDFKWPKEPAYRDSTRWRVFDALEGPGISLNDRLSPYYNEHSKYTTIFGEEMAIGIRPVALYDLAKYIEEEL